MAEGLDVYLVEADDVDHPCTKARSSRGFLFYKVRVELWVTEVLISHTPHRGLRDVLFVKVYQSLQEVIHLHKHLCANGCALDQRVSN